LPELQVQSSPYPYQLSARRPQIAQGKHRDQLSRVLGQSLKVGTVMIDRTMGYPENFRRSIMLMEIFQEKPEVFTVKHVDPTWGKIAKKQF